MKEKIKSQRGHVPRVLRPDVSSDFFAAFFDGLGKPGLSSAFREKGGAAAITVEVEDPSAYEHPGDFLRDYWASESASKYPFQIEGIDRKANALVAFDEAEVRCSSANADLCDAFAKPYQPAFRRVLRQAQAKLKWLLSGITRDEVVQRAGWGPGASTSIRRKHATHQRKWEFATHVTYGALPWVLALRKYANIPQSELEVCQGNKVTTVPKNAKTDRIIAIEPDWNMFFQLGLGRAIRRRLRRVGLLSESAQETNKLLAQLGSRDGTHATIDLKGASDSVSLALCELLLPADLYQLILELRSPVGTVEGKSVLYEKVSSMGNGFTFELETALFWALSSSVAGNASVYGDDIIVQTEYAADVILVLNQCGFVTNAKKTFSSGPFRESCGGHYFRGVDVTPPYFRKPLKDLRYFISGANAMRRRLSGWPCLEYDLSDARSLLTKRVPGFLSGPAEAGDVVLNVDRSECTPKWSRKFQCYTGVGLYQRRALVEAPIIGAYTAALHGDSRTTYEASSQDVVCFGQWYAWSWS